VKVSDTKHHMQWRAPWHNYAHHGTYMLTLVVDGRQPLLGRLKVESTTPEGEPQAVGVELTPLGRAIYEQEASKISLFYPMVEVWKLCIMPDHIHIIVRVKDDMPPGKHLGLVVRGFKTGCSRAWWRLQDEGTMPAGKPAGTVATGSATVPTATPVPAATTAPSAAAASAAIPTAPVPGVFPPGHRPVLFESGYCDKILLREGQLDNWKRYLDDNPRRLALKRHHPDYFTVMHGAVLADMPCQMVGNRFLLDIPDKMAVIVHHAYTDEEYDSYLCQWLACGERGGVLVSAAIATREKMVMREAMNCGYRVIYLRENGFPPMYKPSSEAFNACTDGRLLMVSPWQFHSERRTISREQCLILNRLAEWIANM
jgi:hypothetical protein